MPRRSSLTRRIRLVLVSDTHDLHRKVEVPVGDFYLHAGDISMQGRLDDIRRFDAYLATLPHRHKIVIAGNHDFCFERQPEEARALIRNAVYLQDEATTLEGVKFYGSPWQPWFFDWAFNLPRGEPLREKWQLIPEDVDVLITHGPPQGILDRTDRGEHAGCEELARRVREVRPRLHVFGHIHEAYGMLRDGETTFANACVCTLGYRAGNAPLVFDLEK